MPQRRLISLIKDEINPDEFDDSECLEGFYKLLNHDEKRIVDRTFSILCGLTLRTLLVAKEL